MHFIVFFVVLISLIIFKDNNPVLAENIGIGIILIILSIPLSIVIYVIHVDKTTKKHLASQREYIKSFCNNNKDYLGRQRNFLIQLDHLGEKFYGKWNREVIDFFNKKIKPSSNGLFSKGIVIGKDIIPMEEITSIINAVAKDAEEQDSRDYMTFDSSMNGLDYEYFCANILQELGWNAKVSKASGDQGADIVATKINIPSIAIQCKKYSKPVGNKAVQEVISGQVFYKTKKAVVVTNNSYTKSAKELAKSSGVLLLHHSDLPKLEDIL